MGHKVDFVQFYTPQPGLNECSGNLGAVGKAPHTRMVFTQANKFLTLIAAGKAKVTMNILNAYLPPSPGAIHNILRGTRIILRGMILFLRILFVFVMHLARVQLWPMTSFSSYD